MDTPNFESLAAHIRQIQSEYREMPGLSLTREQAQRLWGLDLNSCVTVLEYLVEARFLNRTGTGSYVRCTDGPAISSAMGMAKAEGYRRASGRDVA